MPLDPATLRALAMYGNALGQGMMGKDNPLAGVGALTQQWGSTEAMGEMLNKILQSGGKMSLDGAKTKLEIPHVQTPGSAENPEMGAVNREQSNAAAASAPTAGGGINPALLALFMGGFGGNSSPFSASLPTGTALVGLTPEDLTQGVRLKLGAQELEQRGAANAAETLARIAQLDLAERGYMLEQRRTDTAEKQAETAEKREKILADAEARKASKPTEQEENYLAWSKDAQARGLPSDRVAYLIAKGQSATYNDYLGEIQSGNIDPKKMPFEIYKLLTDPNAFLQAEAYAKVHGQPFVDDKGAPLTPYTWGIKMMEAQGAARREAPGPAADRAGQIAGAVGQKDEEKWASGRGAALSVAKEIANDPGLRKMQLDAQFASKPADKKAAKEGIEYEYRQRIDKHVKTAFKNRNVVFSLVDGKYGWYDANTKELLRLWIPEEAYTKAEE